MQREADRRAPQGATGRLKRSNMSEMAHDLCTAHVLAQGASGAMDDVVVGFSHAHLIEGGQRRAGKIYPRKNGARRRCLSRKFGLRESVSAHEPVRSGAGN